ncbi:MAG: S8 family serine peptidase [Polyangia bacterium]
MARKLDSGLRRLLTLPEPELHGAVEAETTRLAHARRIVAAIPTAAAELGTAARRALVARLLPHPIWGLVTISPGRLRPLRIRAITHFAGNRQDLLGLGLTVHSQAHDIFTIEGTPDELRLLASQPATAVVRLPRFLLPEVEQASAQAGIADVHQPRPANPTGYQGQGILIGLIDSPLEVRHPAFREAVNPHNTRVLYYWVQDPDSATAPGQTPQGVNATAFNGLNYGRLYTQADINAALGNAAGTYGGGNSQISKAPDPLDSEHGTHTAGIAGGSGHDASYVVGPHVGAAPQATLIHVCNTVNWANLANGTFEDRLIDAIDFIFRAATLHNLRAVVSVSQGTSLGPHDGSSLFDQNRDNLLNSFENRSIVWSAGNDNNDNGFTRGTVAATATASFTFASTVPVAGGANTFLDVWYSGPELDVELRRGAATSGWITAGNELHGSVASNPVDIDRDPEPSSGFRGLRFFVQSTDSSQVFTVNLRNPHGSAAVSYWAWTGIQGQHGSVSGPVHDELTISDTACGRSILTIGASAKVVPPNLASPEPISDYSGAGPTLDGRIKPELVAVGGTAASEIQSANSRVLGGYVGMRGTSMATPLVAGLVALLMQERQLAGSPIDQDTIKGLLVQYADRLNLHLSPDEPGYVATERNLFGYGRVRAIGPIDHHLPPQDVDVWVKTAPDDFGQQPFPGDVYWAAPEIRICPQGSSVETNELHFGQVYDVTVIVRNRGDNPAVGTEVWLKYTRPFAAPNSWAAAQDTNNVALHTTIDVPALGHAEAHFVWRPDSGEIPPPHPDAHFCVLAEVSHVSDVLAYPAPTDSGGSAWESNIKGTNNIALRNVSIQ